MAKKKRRKPGGNARDPGQAPKPTWPRHQNIRRFTDGELYAVAIHPMVTGIGNHPRTVTEEKWVKSFIQRSKEYGEERVLSDMLKVLRMTAGMWDPALAEAQGDLTPRVPDERGDLPQPMVQRFPTDKWTGLGVAEMLTNPAYTGIGRYERMIDDGPWVAANLKQANNYGFKQMIVNILHQLRETYGVPGEHRGRLTIPGYRHRVVDEDGDEVEPDQDEDDGPEGGA